MKLIIFLSFLCLISSEEYMPFVKPKQRHGLKKHVIGGELANNQQFPWHAFIIVVNSVGNGSRICGGSLIADDWILTAAHCLTQSKRVIVKLGSINYKTAKFTATSAEYKMHPNFTENNNNNDIALIKLPQSLPVDTYKTISTIRLPSHADGNDTFLNRTALISGIGDYDTSNKLSNVLRFGKVRVISNEKCSKYFNQGYIVNSTICSVGVSRIEENSCTGDSGGALVVREDDGNWTQIGIASFGSKSGCLLKIPKGLTRVTSYLQWISDITGIAIRN